MENRRAYIKFAYVNAQKAIQLIISPRTKKNKEKMSRRNNNYPPAPILEFGIIDEGFYFKLPIKAVSLNDYKKMHHGAIRNYRKRYKAIIDVILLSVIKQEFIKINGEGVLLNKFLFYSPIMVEWVLSFKENRSRDLGNYTQKILQDSVVDTGMLIDDNYKIVTSDKIYINDSIKEDSITMILLGKVDDTIINFDNNEINRVTKIDLLKGVTND